MAIKLPSINTLRKHIFNDAYAPGTTHMPKTKYPMPSSGGSKKSGLAFKPMGAPKPLKPYEPQKMPPLPGVAPSGYTDYMPGSTSYGGQSNQWIEQKRQMEAPMRPLSDFLQQSLAARRMIPQNLNDLRITPRRIPPRPEPTPGAQKTLQRPTLPGLAGTNNVPYIPGYSEYIGYQPTPIYYNPPTPPAPPVPQYMPPGYNEYINYQPTPTYYNPKPAPGDNTKVPDYVLDPMKNPGEERLIPNIGNSSPLLPNSPQADWRGADANLSLDSDDFWNQFDPNTGRHRLFGDWYTTGQQTNSWDMPGPEFWKVNPMRHAPGYSGAHLPDMRDIDYLQTNAEGNIELQAPITLEAAMEAQGITEQDLGGYYDPGYGGGGGGGGGGEQDDGKYGWREVPIDVENAPPWWKGMVPDRRTETSEYLLSLNAMIPFLGPEDQRVVASYLFQQDPKSFAHLNPSLTGGEDRKSITPFDGSRQTFGQQRQWYWDPTRGSEAMRVLDELQGFMGIEGHEFGPGYQYLRSALQYNKDYMSPSANRANRLQYLDMVKSQTGMAGDTPLAALVQMFSNPNFSGMPPIHGVTNEGQMFVPRSRFL